MNFTERHLASCGSTNTELAAMAAQGAPEGSYVWADEQSAGRGRWGRSWHSAPGENLCFSLLLRPGSGGIGQLSAVMGLGLKRALAAFGVDARLKWPNDLWIGEKKLSGMLLEGGAEALVVGIGLNLNQREFPAELQATSMALECGRSFERAAVLKALLPELARAYAQWRSGEFESLRKEWEAGACFLGQTVRAGGITGVMRGLAGDGGLLIEGAKGLQSLASGEVEGLRPEPRCSGTSLDGLKPSATS